MSIDRLKYKSNKFKSKGKVDNDSFFKINLESENKLLPPDKINKIVNAGEIFNEDRNESTRYRFIGTILPLFSNVLYNISGKKGPNSYENLTSNIASASGLINTSSNPDDISHDESYGLETFDGLLFKTPLFNNNNFNGKTLNYEESFNKHLKEINGWFGFYDPNITKLGFCEFYDLEPRRDRFDLSSSLSIKNWNFTITYPYKHTYDHYLVKDGLLITNSLERVIGGVPMVALGTAAPHNLKVGDSVRISNISNQNMNGDFTVLGLGLENGDYKETYFVIDINPNDADIGPLFNNGRMKRLYYGNEVEYYIRLFTRVKNYRTQKSLNENDCEVYELAFSRNIYDDQNYQIVVKEDIDVSDLTDNLGRPLSELYLTMIKTNSDGLFTRVISGFDFNNQYGNVITSTAQGRNVSNIRKMHTSSAPLEPFKSHTPLETDVKIGDNYYYGDICEYSKLEVKETILQSVTHRFNTVDRETTISKPVNNGANTIDGIRPEGYIYQPHYMIKIRQFSNYIEQGDSSVLGVPDYAENLGDGRLIWRDLLTIGYNDGQQETLDYPFLNGAHYLYDNFCITTKRQDPFGDFGLLYTKKFPMDVNADSISNNFEVKNNNDDEC